MLSGPPLPLPQDIPVHKLLPFAHPPGTLGAWVRGPVHTCHLYEAPLGVSHRILMGSDLGHLLGRCNRIALRQGSSLVVLDADTVIPWRPLQVATPIPYLPSLARLNETFPGTHLDSSGFHVAIAARAPEAVLAECITHGIPVRESRV